MQPSWVGLLFWVRQLVLLVELVNYNVTWLNTCVKYCWFANPKIYYGCMLRPYTFVNIILYMFRDRFMFIR